jgi:hypothetical protein
MAGRRNQRRMAALQRLRARAHGQDDAIRAWQRSTDAVRAAESEVEDLRADYEAKLAVSRAKRARAVRRSAELLAEVAVLVGDDNDTSPSARSAAAPGARGTHIAAYRLLAGGGRPPMQPDSERPARPEPARSRLTWPAGPDGRSSDGTARPRSDTSAGAAWGDNGCEIAVTDSSP